MVASEIDEPVVVVGYNTEWPSIFARDANEIAEAFGQSLTGLEHIGSTAVPGLAAKPIIDIMIALRTWPLAQPDREALEALGYEYLGQAEVVGREYFRRRVGHATNLAVVAWDGDLWRDNLAFRDHLRSHPEMADAYGRRKFAIIEGGVQTLLAYSKAKAPDVDAILQRAER